LYLTQIWLTSSNNKQQQTTSKQLLIAYYYLLFVENYFLLVGFGSDLASQPILPKVFSQLVAEHLCGKDCLV